MLNKWQFPLLTVWLEKSREGEKEKVIVKDVWKYEETYSKDALLKLDIIQVFILHPKKIKQLIIIVRNSFWKFCQLYLFCWLAYFGTLVYLETEIKTSINSTKVRKSSHLDTSWRIDSTSESLTPPPTPNLLHSKYWQQITIIPLIFSRASRYTLKNGEGNNINSTFISVTVFKTTLPGNIPSICWGLLLWPRTFK